VRCRPRPGLAGGLLLKIQECSAIERQVLVERHLVSHELCDGARPRGIYVSPDDRISVMVNEEDHLRIQSLTPGFQLSEAWSLADAADDGLDATLEYAFSEDIGYLTACPTNAAAAARLGTHPSARARAARGVQRVLKSVMQVGLNVRGLYGEHSESWATSSRISNQTTLGRSERDSIESLERVTRQMRRDRGARPRAHAPRCAHAARGQGVACLRHAAVLPHDPGQGGHRPVFGGAARVGHGARGPVSAARR
jgi:protein arginine kinase